MENCRVSIPRSAAAEGRGGTISWGAGEQGRGETVKPQRKAGFFASEAVLSEGRTSCCALTPNPLKLRTPRLFRARRLARRGSRGDQRRPRLVHKALLAVGRVPAGDHAAGEEAAARARRLVVGRDRSNGSVVSHCWRAKTSETSAMMRGTTSSSHISSLNLALHSCTQCVTETRGFMHACRCTHSHKKPI